MATRTPLTDPFAQAKARIREIVELDAQLKAEKQELKADLSLAEFTQAAWGILEPEVPISFTWHMQAICEHLEAVTNSTIRNLIINIPPRMSKSTLVSVMWPVWTWTHLPGRKFLFASYGSELSERDSLKCKRLINSAWYQSRYGRVFQLMKDKDTIQKFETNRGGFRIATSVGGLATGEGADILVADDPIQIDAGNSATQRNLVNRWWSETMSSRLNDQKTGCKVIIMQRVAEEDLTGYVLAQPYGDYTHFCLPMEYEIPRDREGNPLPKPATPIGFSDPRTCDGELLCPERVGPEELLRIKNSNTEYGYAGQYQQRPAPRGGGTFRIDKIEIVQSLPSSARLVRARGWDRAGTKDGGAFTAGALLAWDVSSGIYYVLDMVRGQWATEQRELITKQTAHADSVNTHVVLEQEPGSAGIDSVKATVRNITMDRTAPRGFMIHAIRPTGDKVVRADPLATQVAFGNVKFLQGPWNTALLREMENFPVGRYKDQVDSLSLVFNFLTNIRLASAPPLSSPPPQKFVVR